MALEWNGRKRNTIRNQRRIEKTMTKGEEGLRSVHNEVNKNKARKTKKQAKRYLQEKCREATMGPMHAAHTIQ